MDDLGTSCMGSSADWLPGTGRSWSPYGWPAPRWLEEDSYLLYPAGGRFFDSGMLAGKPVAMWSKCGMGILPMPARLPAFAAQLRFTGWEACATDHITTDSWWALAVVVWPVYHAADRVGAPLNPRVLSRVRPGLLLHAVEFPPPDLLT